MIDQILRWRSVAPTAPGSITGVVRNVATLPLAGIRIDVHTPQSGQTPYQLVNIGTGVELVGIDVSLEPQRSYLPLVE